MKKILFMSVLAVIFLAGCGQQNNQNLNAPIANNNGAENNTTTAQNTNSGELQRFYPETDIINKPVTTPDPKRDFVITQEMEVKFYLVDKYNPGTCYGMPGPVPEVGVQGLINNNPELAQFVKMKYKLSSDLDIYNKIKQLNAIALTKLAGGKYRFNFTNGQCCTLTAYEGEVNILNRAISDSVTRQESNTNPC